MLLQSGEMHAYSVMTLFVSWSSENAVRMAGRQLGFRKPRRA